MNKDQLTPEDEISLSTSKTSNFQFFLASYEILLWKAFLKIATIVEKALGIRIEIKIPFALIRSLPYPLQEALNWLIDKGHIKKINDFSNIFSDEPRFQIYSTIIDPDHEIWSGGIDESPREALIKTIGEAVERQAQSVYDYKKFKIAKFSELRNVLDPLSFAGPSLNQRGQKGWERWRIENDSNFRWIKARSVVTGKKIWVPAQLAYLPYHFHNDPGEPIINWPITTGAAAGLTEEDAMIRGICEVIERDAFIITYLNKLSPPKVDLENSGEFLAKIAAEFKKYFLELNIYALPTDAPVAVMLAVISDLTGFLPAICVGAKAHADPFRAAKGAALEAFHVRIGCKMMLERRTPEKDYSKIRNPGDHVLFWSQNERKGDLDFLNKNGKLISIRQNERTNENTQDSLNNLINFFKQNNLEAIWADLTPKHFRKTGIFIGKAIIPKFQPLFMDERFPYYGGERLYKLPVLLGYLQGPLSEDEFNKLPHPFP